MSATQIFSRLMPYNVPKMYLLMVILGIVIVPIGCICIIIVQVEILVSFLGMDYGYMKSQMRIFLPQFIVV